MMNNLEKLSINYDEMLVQIEIDKELRDFLGCPGNQALRLAKYLKEGYRKEYGTELQISQDSLAIEILAHVYIDKFLVKAGSLNMIHKSVSQVLEKVKEHTDIIDCGEASIDHDRAIWDALVPLKKLIYLFCQQ